MNRDKRRSEQIERLFEQIVSEYNELTGYNITSIDVIYTKLDVTGPLKPNIILKLRKQLGIANQTP